MRYSGRVVRQLFGAGSKSEHQAVVLLTPAGALKLRRSGGNPFRDSQLDELVGQSIVVEGVLHQGQLLMTSWKVVTGDDITD
jgi:hypothetical protein